MSADPIVKARSDLGVAVRWHRPAAEVEEARRNLATEKLAQYVARVVAEAPELREDQISRIVGLLRRPNSGGDSA